MSKASASTRAPILDGLVVRRMRSGSADREAFLSLLDGWPFADGRRGREFFRRYLDHDHRYQPGNVWVAEKATGAARRPFFVSCVQSFPRQLRIRGQSVPAGGIGSVFTRPEFRRRGVAERLLEASARSLRARGFELSLLTATRVPWYRKLGWLPWSPAENASAGMLCLRCGAEGTTSGPGGIQVERLGDECELAELQRIANSYCRDRDGTVLRSTEDWRSSLRLAGDPDEEILVARLGEEVVAYLRVAQLGGTWQVLEWGRRPEAAAALAALFVAALRCISASARAPLADPRLRLPAELVEPTESVPAPNGVTALGDPELAASLRSRGLVAEIDDRAGAPATWMLRVLRRRDLEARVGASPGLADTELLELLLPQRRFRFWPADRF